jgi:hypothetical protein
MNERAEVPYFVEHEPRLRPESACAGPSLLRSPPASRPWRASFTQSPRYSCWRGLFLGYSVVSSRPCFLWPQRKVREHRQMVRGQQRSPVTMESGMVDFQVVIHVHVV